MSDEQQNLPEQQRRPVTYTIDGRPFTGPRKQKASKLLRQAGLKPDGYDLARVGGEGEEPEQFEDDEFVCIDPGDRFVSIREQATVA